MGGTVRVKTLVVARWTEDVSWAASVTGWRVMLVQKGTDVPNRGREPSSFLWAIDRLYDETEPDDTLAFVQGHPFDHCPDLLNRLVEPVTRFSPLGFWHTFSDANGGPHHRGVPVGACYEAWLESPFPGTVEFTAGGQFAISGEALQAHSAEVYQRIYNDLMADEGMKPWAVERLWPAIFR